MKIRLKLPEVLISAVHADLSRRHAFALERVGFLSFSLASADDGTCLLLAKEYASVDDGDYENDCRYGAKIGRSAIRKAMQIALSSKASVFHIHRHEHNGYPRFSSIDLREYPKFVPDFWNVQPDRPHGAIVLSRDRAAALCWYPGAGKRNPLAVSEIWITSQNVRKISRGWYFF